MLYDYNFLKNIRKRISKAYKIKKILKKKSLKLAYIIIIRI
jgi:hypothetical protein